MIIEILADVVSQKIHQWSFFRLKDPLQAATLPLASQVACSFGKTRRKSVIESLLIASTEISSRSPPPLA